MQIIIVTNDKIYTIGQTYKFENIQPFIEPKRLSEVWDSIRHNVSADIQRVKNFLRYKVQSITESLIDGKRVYVVTFLVILGLSFHNLFPTRKVAANLPVAPTVLIDTCQQAVSDVCGKPVSTKEKKKVGRPKVKSKVTSKTKVATSLFASVLRDSLPVLEASTVLFKPDYTQYANKHKEELPSPIGNSIYKKFSSYEDAVIYLFYLGKLHNEDNPNKKINVLSMMFQSGIEMGLRPSSKGWVSKISTFGNNHLGLKTFNESDEFMYAKDDDRNKKGVLIESKFKIFPNFGEAIKYYAKLVSKPRYTGKESAELVYKVNGKTGVTICYPNVTPYIADQYWLQYVKELKDGGYCTSNKYINQVKVTASEMLPILKKHGLI